jgi:hypothetical protein
MRNVAIIIALFILTPFCYSENVQESGATIVYSYDPQTVKTKQIVHSDNNRNNSYEKSPAILFDILLDEKVNENDPRVKSIIYITKSNPKNYIQISYTNPKAADFANNLAILFSSFNIKVQKPNYYQSLSPQNLKNVSVKINYFKQPIEISNESQIESNINSSVKGER